MNILHKQNGRENIYGFEYIYETKDYFIDIIMETTNVYPPKGPIEPTNIIKYLNVEHKDDNYELSYDCERFEVICECYDVVYVGDLTLKVGGKLDF